MFYFWQEELKTPALSRAAGANVLSAGTMGVVVLGELLDHFSVLFRSDSSVDASR